MECFGHEILLDLYLCDPAAVDSLGVCYNFLEGAVRVLGVTKQAPPFVFHSPDEFPDKAGISAWVPLIESGIQLHTLTPKGFVSVDYYTCCPLDGEAGEKLIKLAIAVFKPKFIEKDFIERGKRYYRTGS